MSDLKIVQKSLDEIFPYENNPRNNENAIDAVAESIKEFGFKQPIVIDKENIIVVGHTRYEASKKLGLKKVPCMIADDLSPEQINAYRLADNKSGELAEWDNNALDLELYQVKDIDMGSFGFEIEDIKVDDFNEDFELPSGDKPDVAQMTFTLSNEQVEFIKDQLSKVELPEDVELYGNTNKNGNALFEVVRQWAER